MPVFIISPLLSLWRMAVSTNTHNKTQLIQAGNDISVPAYLETLDFIVLWWCMAVSWCMTWPLTSILNNEWCHKMGVVGLIFKRASSTNDVLRRFVMNLPVCSGSVPNSRPSTNPSFTLFRKHFEDKHKLQSYHWDHLGLELHKTSSILLLSLFALLSKNIWCLLKMFLSKWVILIK